MSTRRPLQLFCFRPNLKKDEKNILFFFIFLVNIFHQFKRILEQIKALYVASEKALLNRFSEVGAAPTQFRKMRSNSETGEF